jgi:hypothetical protein
MFEHLINFIKGLFGDAKIKLKSNCCNKVKCNLKCCNKTNVDVPTPRITKIINVITCSSKNNIEEHKIPWRKVITT